MGPGLGKFDQRVMPGGDVDGGDFVAESQRHRDAFATGNATLPVLAADGNSLSKLWNDDELFVVRAREFCREFLYSADGDGIGCVGGRGVLVGIVRSRDRTGLGLGLSISRRSVEADGGVEDAVMFGGVDLE